MPRVARIVIPGIPHHVTQRGNNRQDVFFVDSDYGLYLRLLAEEAQRRHLDVLGYCLMPNHVHIVATPRTEAALAKALGRTHFRYTQYINRLHGRSGHLWQARFYSCPLDEAHTWSALRYVERNPVRARMVRKAWRYPWSSAALHVGMVNGGEFLNMKQWKGAVPPAEWREELSGPDDDAIILALRKSTHTGRPLGSDSFLSKLERLLGHRVRALPVGRPRAQKKAGSATEIGDCP